MCWFANRQKFSPFLRSSQSLSKRNLVKQNMQIFVQAFQHGRAQSLLCFSMNKTDSVLSLKKNIQDKIGVPSQSLRLVNSATGDVLRNPNESLEFYSVSEFSTLNLSVPLLGGGTRMQICVKTLTGKTLVLDVDSADTVASLKVKILDREGYPIDEQRLLYGGRQLENDKTLEECNVTKLATLYVAFRMKGGQTK